MASATSSVSMASPSTNPTTLASELGQETQFTTISELLDLINCTQEDYLTLKGVSPKDLSAIDKEMHARHRKFRLRRYYFHSKALIISIPSVIHETLHTELYAQFMEKLGFLGLKKSWKSKAGGAFFTAGDPGSDRGEGDSTGGPKEARGKETQWPTLVIEAGVSETMAALRRDMCWWLTASEHAVKIVLLIKLDNEHRQILIERHEEDDTTRQGATTTRAVANTLRPVLRQSINITENTGTVPLSYNVAKGALVLSFRLLFLREPGPGEGDIVFSIPDLQEFAAEVWGIQE